VARDCLQILTDSDLWMMCALWPFWESPIQSFLGVSQVGVVVDVSKGWWWPAAVIITTQ